MVRFNEVTRDWSSLFIITIYVQDLLSVIYTDPSLAGLTDTEGVAQGNQEKAGSGAEPQTSETRTGLRTLCISPDGLHLASGDRMGILRYRARHQHRRVRVLFPV